MNGPIDHLNAMIPALRRGDTAAFRDLVRELAEPLQRYAQQIVGDPGAAADVVQDAMVRIYNSRRRLDEGQLLRGLCFRTVRNMARSHVRDELLRRQREQEAEEMRRETHARARSRSDVMAIRAWELAQRLPEAMREVIELRFAFGLARAEVADALGIPEGTVATRQRQALSTLREQMMASPAVVGVTITAAMLGSALQRGAQQAGGGAAAAGVGGSAAATEASIMAGIHAARVKSITVIVAASLALVLLLGVAVAGLPGGSSVPAGTDPEYRSPFAISPFEKTGNRHTTSTPTTPANSPASNAVDPPNHNDGGTAIDHGTPTPPPTTPPAPPVDPLPPVNPQPADPLPGPADNHPVRDDHKAVAPTISAPADAKVPAGKPWRCAISTTGNPAPKLEADRLPTWLRLDGDVLRGTPAAADAGLVQVVLHASNGTAPDAEHRINIVVGTPPEITSKPVTEAAVGVRYEYAVELAGSPAPTLSAEKLPAWLAIDGTMLVGTPDAADAAKAPIVVKLIARNGFEPDATQELRIGFAGPTINSEPVIEAAGGKTYEYLIATTGSPAPTITASRLPDWMVLDGNRLWGVPRNLDKGRVRIKLTAANGIGKPATQEFTIQVKESDGIQDMPWSLATARSFIVVGLKWTVRQNNILGGNRIGSTEDTYEVIAVNGIGYTTHVKTPRSIQNDVVEWQEGDVMYPWCENVVVLCNPVVGEWTRSKSRIDVLGRKRDCIMLTCTDASLEGARVENYFYCEDYPIGSVQYSDTFSALGQPTGDEWVLETLKRP